MEGRVKVKFLKAMYPYNEGDEGYVAPMIIEQYPDHVEEVGEKVKTKKAPVIEEETNDDKAIDEAPADKQVKKKKSK